MSSSQIPVLPPVRRTIRVGWQPAAAFERFTRDIGAWWPVRTHSVGGVRTEAVVFEERLGGQIYERLTGGERCVWGTVTAWDPPLRVAFTWHPGRTDEQAQDVEVVFSSTGTGTELRLTHTGWERLGAAAPTVRRGYSMGWVYVLAFWAGRTSSPIVWGTDALAWLLKPVRARMERRLEAKMAAARRP